MAAASAATSALARAPLARAAECSSLRFIAVEPFGSTPPAKECDPRIDRLACDVAKGFARFATVKAQDGIHEALQLERTYPSYSTYERYIGRLERSPMIREINRYRIEAREIAARRASHPIHVCEPNYIYIDSSQVFGMGPAFVSSKRFAVLDGDDVHWTTNFITAEDAGAPFHLPLKMISKDQLDHDSYYDVVIAHELAHALMQDLYGVDEFEKLEKRVVSRDGHFASAVTDPTLAWVEGFAEGFEAYFGEKYLTPEQQRTPYLDKLFASVFERVRDFENWGWPGYALTIPATMARTAKTMLQVDKFVSDFLKAERQQPVRDNHYIMQGMMVNLAHYYGVFPAAGVMADADLVAAWEVEGDDAVYSKEGVVAHFIYRCLKEGLLPEVMRAIHWGKPRDFWEFAEELRAELEPEQFARVADAYKTIFTAAGREAVRSRLRNLVDPENRKIVNPAEVEKRYAEALAKITVPARLAPPKDLWVEFWTPSPWRQKLYGRLDRVNLATATPGRIDTFLKTKLAADEDRRRVLDSFLEARSELAARFRTLPELVAQWEARVKQRQPALSGLVRAATDQILLMRRCYDAGCLTVDVTRKLAK